MADPDADSQAGAAKGDKLNDEKMFFAPNLKASTEPTSMHIDSSPLESTTISKATDSVDISEEGKAATGVQSMPVKAGAMECDDQSQEKPPAAASFGGEDVGTSTLPKVSRSPLIIVADSDASEAPVARARSDEAGSSEPASSCVVRTNSDEAGRSAELSTAATAPPTLQNHVSGGSDDDGLDEFIKSPHGQNAIVERSPGGRYVRFMEKLGSGASKDVYRAYDTQEGIEVAWNVVSLAGVPKAERNRIVNEVRLLERLHHHNIISFHGSWVNRERQEVHFVTEILSSGTLKSFINKVQVIRWKIAKKVGYANIERLGIPSLSRPSRYSP